MQYLPRAACALCALTLPILPGAAAPAFADALSGAPTLNMYGATGLIDMPSGEAQPDATFDVAISSFAGITRTTLSFQLSPRVSASFRYSAIANWNAGGFATYYDRSFDLRFKLFDEGRFMPATTIGLQDFAGTGLYSGEYIAATKHLAPGLKVTAGLGWGRLGSNNPMGSFGTRKRWNGGTGGKPNFSEWFHGNVAPFAGVEWHPTRKLGLKLEYSSDAYTLEVGQHGLFRHRSPWNFGVDYRLNETYSLSGFYLYGSQLGAMVRVSLNPKVRPTHGVLGPAPTPVAVRPARTSDPKAWATGWTVEPAAADDLRSKMAKGLAAQGMTLEALSVTATRAQVRFHNGQFESAPQAIGRVARLMSRVMPASVETFEIVPVVHGIPASKVTIRRTDLERLEFAPDAAASLRARVRFGDAAGRLPPGAIRDPALAPRFTWSVAPYLRLRYFDPKSPLRADLDLRAAASYRIRPGLILSGDITKKVIGNLDKSRLPPDSSLPHVRTDAPLYDAQGDPALERLTLAWYARPGRNLYSRVTAGYLEQMYGGVSGELLWKPVASRLALGAEVNFVRKRAYDERFSFRHYKVVTGHASLYYQFNDGYFGEIDAGRYLAGDWGATFTFDRIFANGWRIGAFATFTNVSAQQFGEGSFDKGIRILIPLSWGIGHPTRAGSMAVIHPLLRDGGARLDVQGRLYESLRDYHADALGKDWGRVWR